MRKYDRAVLAIYSLVLMAVFIFVLLFIFNKIFMNSVLDFLSQDLSRFSIGFLAVLVIIISFKTLVDVFSKTTPAYALIQTTDLGTVSITISAIEHLVSKAAKQVKGIKDIKSRVKPVAEGIALSLQASINPESNIPMITQELQDTVKGYIEQIAGLKVVEAKVLVDYISQDLKPRVD